MIGKSYSLLDVQQLCSIIPDLQCAVAVYTHAIYEIKAHITVCPCSMKALKTVKRVSSMGSPTLTPAHPLVAKLQLS